MSDEGQNQENPPQKPQKRRENPARKLDLDRLPPNSGEAEAAVLGCCLLDPENALNECAEAGMEAKWFYDLRHAVIFKALVEMEAANVDIDTVTLHDWLKTQGKLESIGGVEFLSELPDKVASAAFIGSYIQILRDRYLLRAMQRTCVGAAGAVYDYEGQADDLLGKVEREIIKLSEARLDVSEVRLKQIILKVVQDMEDYHRGKAQIRGLTTGLEYLDKLLCGFGGAHGNYIVLSGRPGTGKTSLAMQIAAHVAKDLEWWEPVLKDGKPVVEKDEEGKEHFKFEPRKGMPVGIFSLEMAATALVERMLYQRAGADMQRSRTGFLEQGDIPKLTAAAAQLVEPDNIFIDDAGRCTIDVLRAKARRMFRQHGIKLFIIDYIQLMRAGKRFRDDRVQELGEISGEIQNLGKEFQVPFIVLAQMNRDYEKEPNRVPRLSDLKDCGSIEQDADVVGFLYQPKMKAENKDDYDRAMEKVYGNDWSKYPERVNLLIAKARYGPTGPAQMLFQKSCTRFHDWNVWRKAHGLAALAKGDARPKPDLEGLDL